MEMMEGGRSHIQTIPLMVWPGARWSCELRFYCGGERVRVTYWIAPGRRIIALTMFAKTRMRETAEIGRTVRAMTLCQEAGHTPNEDEQEEKRR